MADKSPRLLINASTTGAGDAVIAPQGYARTYQAMGATESGTGSATILVRGTNNGGVTWDTIGTITLTLGTTATSDGFTSQDRYSQLSGSVSAITGTGAKVSLDVSS